MLNSASDYEFVDVSNAGSFIHGKPLPVRYTSSSTSGAATCAYEDYLYLLEAYYERMNPEQVGTNNITPSPRTVVAAAAEATTWTQSVGVIPTYNNSQHYINSSSTWPMALTQISTSSGRTSTALSGYALTLTAPKYSSYFIRSKSTRSIEGWCRRFYDYHMLKRLAKGMMYINATGAITSFAGTTTRRTYRSDGTYSDTTTPYTFSNYSGWGYYYTASANSQTIYSPNYTLMQSLNLPHVSSATMLATCSLMVGGSYVGTWCKPIPLNISNGSVSFSNSNWITEFAKEIVELNGYQYIVSFQGQGAQQSDIIIAEIGDCLLIADFDFPADYQTWSWQPS